MREAIAEASIAVRNWTTRRGKQSSADATDDVSSAVFPLLSQVRVDSCDAAALSAMPA